MDDDEQPSIVLDNGSGAIKCGFSGDDAPRCVVPCVIGRPLHGAGSEEAPAGSLLGGLRVGSPALEEKDSLDLARPMARGLVTSWPDMERLWHHTFYDELRVDPSDFQILVTDTVLSPLRHREQLLESLFETFCVPAMFVQTQALLSLYGNGRGTGVTLECGDGVAQVVPIFEGYSLPSGIRKIDLSGRDLTEHMQKLLLESGHSFTGSSGLEAVRSIKEQLCYIAEDFNEELKAPGPEQEHELPDGTVISVGSQLFRCPEVLFKPYTAGHETDGIHELVAGAIAACPMDVRADLYCNVLLAGGSTMFRGFQERLRREVSALAPARARVRVMAPPERKYSAWIGGSILSSLSTFQDRWILKQEYDEEGAGIVHARCPQ